MRVLKRFFPTPARSWIIALFVALFVTLNGTTGALAQQTTDPRPMPPPPPIPFQPQPGIQHPDLPIFQKIAPGVFGLGDIQISKAAGSISFPALVNMDRGMLEYLVVRDGGKTHESLFRTPIDPTQLQMSLLLLGIEGTNQPLSRQGDPDAPRGNPVEIKVSHLVNGRMVQLAPETWIARKTGEVLGKTEPLQWMYTGSTISNGRFLAQSEGSVIALYHDPAALIDNASPGGENDRIWFVDEATVPPVGTPVTLTIRIKN